MSPHIRAAHMSLNGALSPIINYRTIIIRILYMKIFATWRPLLDVVVGPRKSARSSIIKLSARNVCKFPFYDHKNAVAKG